MAGDWIKMRVNLRSDLAVKGIARRTGLNRFDVIGRLHAVWSWADQHLRTGNALGVTAADLDEEAEHPGFAQAMADEQWLKILSTGLVFPYFDRHNGKPAKERALTSKRVKRHRNADGTISTVTPALTEKRREDVSNSSTTVAKSTGASQPDAEPPEEKARSTPAATTKAVRKTQALLKAQREVEVAPKPENFPVVKPPPKLKLDWWRTPAGVAAKGREQDMVRSPNEEPVVFKARVMARLGDGPWLDDLTRAERMLFDRFSAKPPDELVKKPEQPAGNAGQPA